MTPIAVVGDRETVLAFRLGGVPGHVVDRVEDARAVVDAAGAAGGLVLLLVTHGAAQRIRAHLDRLMLDPHAPLVLEIPGFAEAAGEHPVVRFVERVLGIHL